MDHPVGFTDASLSTRWPSAFSDPTGWKRTSAPAQLFLYEFQVNGS